MNGDVIGVCQRAMADPGFAKGSGMATVSAMLEPIMGLRGWIAGGVRERSPHEAESFSSIFIQRRGPKVEYLNETKLSAICICGSDDRPLLLVVVCGPPHTMDRTR